tara:strand:- start:44 stop:628 length:585 start_codon:yes stop_codon:yes gene_type:complete
MEHTRLAPRQVVLLALGLQQRMVEEPEGTTQTAWEVGVKPPALLVELLITAVIVQVRVLAVLAQQEVGEEQDTLRMAEQVGTARLINPRIAEMVAAVVAGALLFLKVLAAAVWVYLVRVLTELKAVRMFKLEVAQAAEMGRTKMEDYTVQAAAVIQVFIAVLGALADRGLLELYSAPEELFLPQMYLYCLVMAM